jgi:hypothetical protein
MLRKQLITLAAILGILSCGACFLPDLVDRTPPEPPPAIVINLRGIREVAIYVACEPQPSHLRCSGIAGHARASLNSMRPHTGVGAHLKSDGGTDDAALEISAIEGVVVPDGPLVAGKEVEWKLPIHVSARLVKRDGTVVWSEEAGDYSYDLFSREQMPDGVWKNRRLHGWAEEWVGQAVVSEMLYGVKHK